jgi:hypothetical protein
MARRGDLVRIEEVDSSAVSNAADPDNYLYDSGGLLPNPHAILAGPTFQAWVDAGEREPESSVVS